ncbi:hypothetical protein [Roseivirga sp.]|uniref:hypothetical protein n=1 Tax=Roseivirga sp. TaxID=1964215 RepID=UPI003B8D65BF
MKKSIYLLLVIIIVLSCENDITPISLEHFNVKEIVNSSNETYTETEEFTYDTENRIKSVLRTISSDPDLVWDGELIEFQYAGDLLMSRTHMYLPSDTIYQQIDYTYYSDGKLHEQRFSYPYTGELSVQWIKEYQYNSNGLVESTRSYNPNTTDPQSSNRYFWQNGNISKIETYYHETLRYEADFTYDNARNYKLGNPYFNDYEASITNNNNITQVRYTDYSGLLDLACNPCNYSYEYNENALPVKVNGPTSYSFTLSISYDIPGNGIN